jgi:hypothetical protein
MNFCATGREVVETDKANMFGNWRILRCRNPVPSLAIGQSTLAGQPDARMNAGG